MGNKKVSSEVLLVEISTMEKQVKDEESLLATYTGISREIAADYVQKSRDSLMNLYREFLFRRRYGLLK